MRAIGRTRARRRAGLRAGLRVGVMLGVLTLALAGCQTPREGDDVPDLTPGGDDRPPATAEPGEWGDLGPDVVVLEVKVGGGFVPMGWDFRQVPTITVYGDGRAIVPGPTTLQYPGAALPNLLEVRLPDGAVGEILDAAAAAGLLGEAPDYGAPPVTDLPTTTVRISDGTATYEHAAYALDAGVGEEVGLTPEQSAARTALIDVVAEATWRATSGGEEPYEASAVAFLAWPVGPDAAPSAYEPAVLPWPLADVALADAGQCASVDGADAQALLEVLRGANELTRFEQDGVTYELFVRPLLPHETGCVDLGF